MRASGSESCYTEDGLATLVPNPSAPEEGHSPAEWQQIEDAPSIAAVQAAIRSAAQADAFRAAELYELAYPGYAGDRDFYLNKAKQGRVLYLGAGAGRLFGDMARTNPQVVAVERSPQMADMLRERHPHVRPDQLIVADAVTVELEGESFDTVIAPFSFLQVVNEESLPQLLANIDGALKPGGRFYTDTFSPYLIPFRKPGLEASIRRIGAETRIAIYIAYDHLKQTMHEMAYVDKDGHPTTLHMYLQYYFPKEVVRALEQAGFDEPTVGGGYRGEPFDPVTNEVFVYQARKPLASPARADANGA